MESIALPIMHRELLGVTRVCERRRLNRGDHRFAFDWTAGPASERHRVRQFLVHGFQVQAQLFCDELPLALDVSPRGAIAVADESGKCLLVQEELKEGSVDDRVLRSKAVIGQQSNACFAVQWLDEREILSGSGDRSISLWHCDGSNSARVCSYYGHKGSVRWVRRVGSSSSMFISACRSGEVRRWDKREPAKGHCWPVGRRGRLNAQSISGLSVSADERLFAASVDSAVSFWDLRRNSKQPLKTIRQRPNKAVSSLCFDPSGSRLAINYVKGAPLVCKWVADDDEAEDHENTRRQLAAGSTGYLCDSFYVQSSFSPCGNFLASGSSDCNMYIWDLSAPAASPLVSFSGHAEEMNSVYWDPANESRILSMSDDQSIISWGVDVRKVNRARSRTKLEARATTRGQCMLPILSKSNRGQEKQTVLPGLERKRKRSRDATLFDFWDTGLPSWKQKKAPSEPCKDQDESDKENQN